MGAGNKKWRREGSEVETEGSEMRRENQRWKSQDLKVGFGGSSQVWR